MPGTPTTATYWRYRAEGRCVRCGGKRVEKGLSCERCKRRIRLANVIRRRRLTLRGLCIECATRKKRQGLQRCVACAKAHADYNRKSRLALLREGRCVKCAGPNDTEGSRCSMCRRKLAAGRRARYHFRKSSGLCAVCGSAFRGSGRNCPACRDADKVRGRRRYHKRQSEGVCCGCGKEPRHPESRAYCLKCLQRLRKATRKNAGCGEYRPGASGPVPIELRTGSKRA